MGCINCFSDNYNLFLFYEKKNHSIKRQKIQLICHGICQHATRLNSAQATAPSNCIAWLIRMYKKILAFFSLSVLFYIFIL